MNLRGGPELKRRLRAIKATFKPIGKRWADDFVAMAKPAVPVGTHEGPDGHRPGHLRKSIRRKNASMRRATVTADYWAFFVDQGPKAHVITPGGGRGLKGREARGLGRSRILGPWQHECRTVFARRVQHPGYPARPFRVRIAMAAARRNPMAQELIQLWNDAA